MKKIFSVLLSTLMLFSIGNLTAFAAPAATKSATVYVTIADDNQELMLAQEPIFVTDLNSDGKLTIDETLVCAHDAKYEGGADAGYAKSGAMISKLWGIENGGNFMYFLNNVAAMGLDDEVTDNSYLNAFALKDTTTWSDTYSAFDINTKNIIEGEEVTLTLSKFVFDMNTMQDVKLPVSNATITLNGVATNYKTNEKGQATITTNEIGSNVVSATTDEFILVPPVCKLNVSPASVTSFVTVVDDNKEFQLTQEPITVTDMNNDKMLTIDDAFICAHNQKFPGGAEAGYKANDGFMTKFWGVENGGSYGYYLNNNMAMGLFETLNDGDYIDAFIYSDPANYSDEYAFFDTHTKEIEPNSQVTLNLSKYEFDPVTYEPIKVAVKNATISINGVKSDYKTDENGNVTLTLTEAGTYTITANSDEFNMVPSACVVTVKSNAIDNNDTNINNDTNVDANNNESPKSPNTGSEEFITFSVIAFASAAVLLVSAKKAKKYED